MRSDFLGAFQDHPALVGLAAELFPVGPMTAAGITDVIEGPAAVAGLELGTGLTQTLVADTSAPDALPLLAFTLRELYDHGAADGRLDVSEYQDLGGLDGALRNAADDLLDAQHLDVEQEVLLRRAFLAMVRLTDDDRRVRQVVRWDDLPAAVHPTLEQFVDARLLVSSNDGEGRTVEVAHEALFRSWDRLAGGSTATSRRCGSVGHCTSPPRAGSEAGNQPSDLWRGGRLTRAVELAASGDLSLAAEERAFLDAAVGQEQAEHEREERTRRRRLRVAGAVAAGAVVLASVAILFYVQARRQSERARRRGCNEAPALAMASEAQHLTAENPALGLALAAEAATNTPSPLPQATAAVVAGRVRSGEPSWATDRRAGHCQRLRRHGPRVRRRRRPLHHDGR